MNDPGPQRPATERLAITRERMRRSMAGRAEDDRGSSDRSPGAMPAWLESLSTLPGIGVVVDAVHSWWTQHPMGVAGMVAMDAAKGMVRPLARKHPIGLIVGAAVAGGLIVWLKPWRGIVKPALFAGLMPQVISHTMARIPLESWFAMLASLAQRPAPRAAASESKTPEAEKTTADEPPAVQAATDENAAASAPVTTPLH